MDMVDEFRTRKDTERAKAALHPLPVVPNGVSEVLVPSLKLVMAAAAEYSADWSVPDTRKAIYCAIWIAFKCTPLRLQNIARAMGRNAGALSRLVARIDKSIDDGGDVCGIIDGILQILVREGNTVPGIVRERRERDHKIRLPKPEETKVPYVQDPRWIEAKKLRGMGWSYTRIAKRTGIDLKDAAMICGVELHPVNV